MFLKLRIIHLLRIIIISCRLLMKKVDMPYVTNADNISSARKKRGNIYSMAFIFVYIFTYK